MAEAPDGRQESDAVVEPPSLRMVVAPVERAVVPVKRAVEEAVEAEMASKRCGRFLFSPHVWWRHPVARMLVAWVILLQDFFIYGEDPVNDSHVTANFPGMGHVLGLLAFWTADSALLGLLRFVFVVLSLVGGFIVGRVLLVKLLRGRWELMLFEGCEGALCTVSVTSCVMLMMASVIYNLCLPADATPLGGYSMEMLQLLGARSLQYRHVNQSFQTLSASVDVFAIVMITDVVLQDTRRYPNWLAAVKRVWVGGGGYVRVVAAWIVMIVGCVTFGALVFSTGKEGDDIRWTDTTLGGTTEFLRGLLAACIVFTDLLTVAQDWDFPMFQEPLEVEVPVKIAGTFWTRLQCNCIGALARKLPRVALPACIQGVMPSIDDLQLSINGKWLTFGPLLGVMVIDLFCAKTQLFYDPVNYGQYVDPEDDRIYVIVDEAYLALAYENGAAVRPEMVSYTARWNQTTGLPLSASAATDVKLNSRYSGDGVAYLWLFVALALIVVFVAMLRVADWRLRRGLHNFMRSRSFGSTDTDQFGSTPAEQPAEPAEQPAGGVDAGSRQGSEVAPATVGASSGNTQDN